MAVHRCGWCGTSTHMTVFAGGQIERVEEEGRTLYLTEASFSCDECGRLSIGTYLGPSTATDNSFSRIGHFFQTKEPNIWAPQYVEGQSFPDVPTHIADAASEAHKSKSIGNVKSAILMARTVVEATAKAKGVTNGSLFSKIDELRKADVIQELTKETAHSIREFGNDMAHGDIELPVGDEEADLVLGFMDALLTEVFQTPAKLAALKSAVAARKNPPTS